MYLSLSQLPNCINTPLRILMDEVQAALEIQGASSFFTKLVFKKSLSPNRAANK